MLGKYWRDDGAAYLSDAALGCGQIAGVHCVRPVLPVSRVSDSGA